MAIVKCNVEFNCCFCFSDEDLFSMLEPYDFDGKHEVYSAMIEECFQIELKPDLKDDSGEVCMICKNCIYRLRDALHLRFQVQNAHDRFRTSFSIKIDQNKTSDVEVDNEEDPFSRDSEELEADDEKVVNMKMEPHITLIEDAEELESDIKESKNYTCDTCEKSFTRKAMLNDHISSHADDNNKARCDMCKRSFDTKDGLEGHKNRVHSKCRFPKIKDKYHCLECGKTFSTNYYMHVHKKIHLKIRDHVCNLCDKAFMQKSGLTRHMLSHMGIRKHQCEVCKKSFMSKRNLRDHMKIHYGIKDIVCGLCDKAYRDSSSLRIHMRTHTDEKRFQCDICEKFFKLKSVLTKHILIHSNRKDFICSECGKAFITSWNLKSHMIIHTGEKKYQCEFCGKSFSFKQSYKYHIKHHHPNGEADKNVDD